MREIAALPVLARRCFQLFSNSFQADLPTPPNLDVRRLPEILLGVQKNQMGQMGTAGRVIQMADWD